MKRLHLHLMNHGNCYIIYPYIHLTLFYLTLLLSFQWSECMCTWWAMEMAMDVAAFEHTQRNSQKREQSARSTVRSIMFATNRTKYPYIHLTLFYLTLLLRFQWFKYDLFLPLSDNLWTTSRLPPHTACQGSQIKLLHHSHVYSWLCSKWRLLRVHHWKHC